MVTRLLKRLPTTCQAWTPKEIWGSSPVISDSYATRSVPPGLGCCAQPAGDANTTHATITTVMPMPNLCPFIVVPPERSRLSPVGGRLWFSQAQVLADHQI